MAHIAKYKANAFSHMIAHYEHKYDRDNIDKELSHNNYTISCREQSDKDYYEERKSHIEEYKKVRKDGVTFADIIFTLPREYKGDEQKFFLACYEFCYNRYGKDNMLSGYVHKDEPGARSHMHVAIMTVEKDKKGHERFYSHMIDRRDLQSFHMDLQHYLEVEKNIHARVINHSTKDLKEERDVLYYENQFYEKYFNIDYEVMVARDNYVREQMSFDKDVRIHDNKSKDLEHEHYKDR